MAKILIVGIVFGLACLIQTAFCSHVDGEDDMEGEMERRRVYCARIARVSKRETFHVRPVVCSSGFEFCYTSTTCCCEIQHENRTNYGLICGLTVGAIVFVMLVLMFMCYPRRRHPVVRDNESVTDLDTVVKNRAFPDNSIHNYVAQHGLFETRDRPPSKAKYGPPSAYGDDSYDSFDVGKAPLSISESLPPPPYSEHSFAVGPGAAAGQMVLYKPERDVDRSVYGYTKRSSRPSSVMSWIKTQDGASLPRSSRRSSQGSNRSVARNSRHGASRGGSINEGFQNEPNDHYMKTIPSVRSLSTRGSTKAASEVIYDSVGNKSRGGAPSMRADDVASQAGSKVSYNPASIAAAMEY